jgi:hypothetical protein
LWVKLSEDGREMAHTGEQAAVMLLMNVGLFSQSERNVFIHSIQRGKEGTPTIDEATNRIWRQVKNLQTIEYRHGPARERKKVNVRFVLAADLLSIWKMTKTGYGPGKTRATAEPCPFCQVWFFFFFFFFFFLGVWADFFFFKCSGEELGAHEEYQQGKFRAWDGHYPNKDFPGDIIMVRENVPAQFFFLLWLSVSWCRLYHAAII